MFRTVTIVICLHVVTFLATGCRWVVKPGNADITTTHLSAAPSVAPSTLSTGASIPTMVPQKSFIPHSEKHQWDKTFFGNYKINRSEVNVADQQTTLNPSNSDDVLIYERTVTLLTYPYEAYQEAAHNPDYNWPYARFDRERYLLDAPAPEPRTYRLLVLENRYLEILLLPELGGRIWQIRHKSTNNAIFYQNSVIKPSPWGPTEQLGWLAVGGLEWNLPVVEHGYDWGTPWDAVIHDSGPERAVVTLATPQDGRWLEAQITLTLRAERADLEISPTVRNLTPKPLNFDYWHTAMLAPGPGNRPSQDLRFVLPTTQMMVHSTGDETLPPSSEIFPWPFYYERDLSRLGSWDHYIGMFEAPAAHGPFTGVYDYRDDAGAVHVFPAEILRGSKLFGLGWRNALVSDYFTDDESAYVELHSGLSPSFFAPTLLAGHTELTWHESWYPVQGIKGLTYGNATAALSAQMVDDELQLGFYPILPVAGTLHIATGVQAEKNPLEKTYQASPNVPWQGTVKGIEWDEEPITITFFNQSDRPLLTYQFTKK